MKDGLPRYSLRMNRILLNKLEYIAEFEGRSKNKEIEQIVREYIKEFEEEHGEIPWKDHH